jgi:hypothetical protein
MALATGSFLFWAMACAPVEKPNINFYHWESKLSIDSLDQKVFKNVGSQKLYVRFFDVSYISDRQEVLPNAVLTFKNFKKEQTALEIIPVVYIENEAIKNYNGTAEKLAQLIWQKVERMAKNNGIAVNELQLDCDWTVSTKNFFLGLCTEFKKLLPKPVALSSTLRLHQLKYPEISGVPNVHYAVLMYYNMGNLSDSLEKNSILNHETGTKYLVGLKDYPLELKLALPAFSWGVVFNEKGIKGLISDFDPKKLAESNAIKDKSGHYLIKENQYLGGTFLNENDRIRVEQIDLDELEEACKDLFSSYNFKEIILYHIHGKNIREGEANKIADLIHSN